MNKAGEIASLLAAVWFVIPSAKSHDVTTENKGCPRVLCQSPAACIHVVNAYNLLLIYSQHTAVFNGIGEGLYWGTT